MSDPPDKRGANASARAWVAHAMVSGSDRDIGTWQWAAKSAAPSRGVAALGAEIVRGESLTAIDGESVGGALWI